MAYPIIMPSIGDTFGRPLQSFRKWIVSENRSAGIGSVLSRTLADLVRSTPMFACFHKWFVEEGESVTPGQVIAEVLVDGVAMSITNHGYGIVESRVEMDDMTVYAGRRYHLQHYVALRPFVAHQRSYS